MAGRSNENEAHRLAFDAALRDLPVPEPDPDLRDACLPRRRYLRRVLVVDDEPNIVRLVRTQLERAGYEVSTAASGPEALARVQALRPDLIVLDVMMPGPSGFEVLHALKGTPETAEIKVVMLTARSQSDDVRHGWQIGADFYMSKPFNPCELVEVVNRFAAVAGTPEDPPPLRRWAK